MDSGVWDYSKTAHYFNRLPLIQRQLQDAIKQYGPDEIALETLIYVKSPTSLIKLAHARGAIIAAIPTRYCDLIFEYAPNLIKTTVTGHGHVDKQGIQRTLSMMLGIQDYCTDDESDALAIALCHALHRRAGHSERPAKGKGRLGKQLAHAVPRAQG